MIEYRVTYLNAKAGSIPTSVLPRLMTAVFANNFVLTRIDGFMGQFSLSYISDSRSRKVTNLLKLFDKRYVYYGKAGELPVCMKPFKSLKIKEDSSDIKFAGFNCRKLMLSSSDYHDFSILCTDQIAVNIPNESTPFNAINDVLLKFNIRLSLLDMQLNTSRYAMEDVSWSFFNVPSDYVVVSREKMENVINEIFK